MKLSLAKKSGMVHIRAGRVVTVAFDHQVPTGTESSNEPAKYRRATGKEWATAKVGDLAVELVAVETDKTFGFGYLSGDAIRLNLYRNDPPDHWFATAKGLRASTERLSDHSNGNMSVERFVHGLMRCKYADAAVVSFLLPVKSPKVGAAVGKAFAQCYRYVPEPMTDEEATTGQQAHLMGRIFCKKRWSDKTWMTLLHFQPPKQASELAVSGFHNVLLHGSPHLVDFDPWDPHPTNPFVVTPDRATPESPQP